MERLRALAHVASAAATIPALLNRLDGVEMYRQVVAELRSGSTSTLPWAVALRAAHAEVRLGFGTVPSFGITAVMQAAERPPPPPVGEIIGTAPAQRSGPGGRLRTTPALTAPELPSVGAICQASDEPLCAGLLSDGARWLAMTDFADAWDIAGDLDRARMGA